MERKVEKDQHPSTRRPPASEYGDGGSQPMMNPRGSNSPPASQDNDEGLPQKPDTMSGYFLVNEGRQGLAARSTGVRSESNPAVGFESHRPRSSSPGTGGKDPVQEGTLSTDLQAASNDPARDVSPGKKTNGTSDSREESKTSPGVILHSNLRDLEVRIASKTSTSTSTSTIIGVVESDKLAAMNKHRLSNANSGGVDTDVEMGSEHGRNELAIAIEVDEEDGDFIASAVEYDPDSKPPLYRNRRFRLYSILCFLFLVMLAIGITGLSTKNEVSLEAKAEAASPIASETNRVGSEDIIEQLELIVGAEVLNDPSSAEYRAKEWIIDVDPLQLGSQDIGLSQRYVLAVLYFKLHEDGDWRSCNAPSESDPSDICNYQKQVSIFPREFRSVASSRWLSGDHECRWAGLGCDDFNQLRTIDLTGQDIQGTLPVELTNFQLLQGIGLSWNKFRGSIPEEIGEMPHLLNLELHYNQLSGSLPSNLENSKNLQLVNLGSNALTGSIPESIGNMSNIKGLFLQDNSLTGAIPSSLSQVSLLTYLRLNNNPLTGTFPSEIGQISLRELWLQKTEISGEIPSEIGRMKNLLDLRLHFTNLKGTIPDEMWQLTKLFRLDLFETDISGSLSPRIADLEQLDILRLRNMDLSGTIPYDLASLENLKILWFDGNNFTGSVPDELCNATLPIEQLVADCLPSNSTSQPQVSCDCCDICCDPTSGSCVVV